MDSRFSSAGDVKIRYKTARSFGFDPPQSFGFDPLQSFKDFCAAVGHATSCSMQRL